MYLLPHSSCSSLPVVERKDLGTKTLVMPENERIKKTLGLKRVYECDECVSKYIHYSALYSHKKTKHGNTPNFNQKKMKKPPNTVKARKRAQKKENTVQCSIKESFLSSLKCLGTKLREIYMNINSPDETYPLYQKLIHATVIEKEKMTCDDVFVVYLKETSTAVNNSYFCQTILTMIIVFREFLNIQGPEYKKMLLNSHVINYIEENKEYCTFYTPEDVPELSNDFFGYLAATEKFYSVFKVSEQDFMNEFMKFFTWLFENEFVSYKIFLIGNNV